jgi:hypothetical protein
MSAQDYGFLVTALLGLAAVAAAPGWSRAGQVIWPPFSLLILMTALGVAGGAPDVEIDAGGVTVLAVGLAAALAVVGGGPATALLFRVVDRDRSAQDGSIEGTPAVPRSELWIGLLERAAVFVALLAGFPEGVAIALAVKAIGRYPELRAPGAGERFIVGTFANALWASACAGVVLLAR